MGSRTVTFELMVRNDVSSSSPNNYVNADDTTTPVIAATDDTSQFDLDISESNISRLDILSYQILTNDTTGALKPEFITIEDPLIKTQNTVVSSSNNVLPNVWAALNTNTDFQKVYGSLDYKVNINPSMLVKKLRIRFYEASLQPFNLTSASFPGANNMFRSLLTVRVHYCS